MSAPVHDVSFTMRVLYPPGPLLGPSSTAPPNSPPPNETADPRAKDRRRSLALECQLAGDGGKIAGGAVRFKRDGTASKVSQMFISTISTSFGRVRATEPDQIIFPTNAVDALTFARKIDREADAEMMLGHHEAADRLSHLAYELRARATGARA